jgi:hypothetical protein
MVAPGTPRPGKFRGGIIQIHLTRSCDKACFGCTQGSQLRSAPARFMSLENFDAACRSLKGYWGVVGIFGGNPALHPQFEMVCEILKSHVPYDRRGIWCNHPLGKGRKMASTFNPAISNLNVHLDHEAYRQFKRDWPECSPVGLTQDSRHSPCYVSMTDLGVPEEERWELISRCDINQHWSAMIGEFRGQLRAWFCEVAGAQSILHQDEPDYPDTGLDPNVQYEHHTAPGDRIEKTIGKWWQLGMNHFAGQVRKHCHECGVPMRGHGELAQAGAAGKEQVSETHRAVFRPKQQSRAVELVTVREQLGAPLGRMTHYLQNAEK